jgi:hypothetical protein
MSTATVPAQANKRLGTKKFAKLATKVLVQQAATTPATYAAQQNARYNHTGSIYVNLSQRFNNTLANLPAMKATGIRAQIAAACKEFQKRYPHVTKFSDLQLADAKLTTLGTIFIDITIQRLLDLGWVVTILKNFREVQADPIKLYEVMDGGDLAKELGVGTVFASWDAQHTAIVYWIIAVMINKEDPMKVEVPSVIYKVKNRADIRENFVNGNSRAGKHLLDSIDLFAQMVSGVRVDGSKDTKWEEAELKQQYLEQADLFVTAEKFGNTHMPGAISRMAEIDKYTSDVIRKFCLYSSQIDPPRPIDSQEIEIMCAWFDMAKNAGIDYDDAQVVELATYVLNTFGQDWGNEASPFWDKVKHSYQNWHNKYYKKFPASMRPNSRMAKNWNTGGTFLWAQLNKSWNHNPLPPLSNSTPFVPDNNDLY